MRDAWSPQKRRPAERGAALVAVLWISLFITTIGGATAFLAQNELRRIDIALRSAEARSLAEGAVRFAAAQLFYEEPQTIGAAERGAPLVIESAGATIEIRFSHEASKPDLNVAGLAELQAGFEALGAEPGAAAAMAGAVLDFRDPDDLSGALGAEADAYRRAGLSWGPRNGAFQHVEELGLVLGVTPEIAAAADSVFTVDGAWRQPLRLDGRTEDRDEAPPFDRFRRIGEQLAPTVSRRPSGGVSHRRIWRITASARTRSGARAEITAIVGPPGGGLGDHEFLAWDLPTPAGQ